MKSIRAVSLAVGSLSAAFVALAVQPQAIADTIETSSLGEQSLLSPQPLDVERRLASQPRPIAPKAASVLPEVPLRLVIRLSDRRVYLYRGDRLERSFPVAIGRAGWETPTGEFEVLSKLENPGWTNPLTNEVFPPGPDNPLGDRWIAFWTDGNNEIGFHGTPNPESVGQAASHGCVRMYNEDVQELFQLVEIGTVVTVEP